MIENVKIQFENALFNKRKNLDSKTYKIKPKKIGVKSIFRKSLQPLIGSFCYNSLVRINDPTIDPRDYLPSLIE